MKRRPSDPDQPVLRAPPGAEPRPQPDEVFAPPERAGAPEHVHNTEEPRYSTKLKQARPDEPGGDEEAPPPREWRYGMPEPAPDSHAAALAEFHANWREQLAARDATEDVNVPEAARERFTDNWEQAQPAVAAGPRRLLGIRGTEMLFHEGRFERSLVGGIVLLAALLWAAIYFLRARDRAPDGPAGPWRSSLSVARKAENLTIHSAWTTIVQPYFAADTIAGKMPYIRHAESSAVRMEGWYRDHLMDTSHGATLFHGIAEKDNITLFAVTEPGHQHHCVFMRDSSEGWKIDWETSSGWQKTPWPKLIREARPASIRALAVKRGDYYNFAFADRNQWKCWELAIPGGDVTLFGYLNAASDEARQLHELFQRLPFVALELDIEFPPPPRDPNQVLIKSVRRFSWVDDG